LFLLLSFSRMLLVIQMVGKAAAICVFSIKKDVYHKRRQYKKNFLIKMEYKGTEKIILQVLETKHPPVASTKCHYDIK